MGRNDSAVEALCSNHLILKIIFSNLHDLSDLCSARRVCRIWQTETRPFIEPRVLVTIEWETKNLLPSQRKANPSIAEFVKYVDAVSPQNVLFHHFILLDWNKSEKFQFISQEFWETCGPLIKSLKIDKLWISPFEEDILSRILFEYTPNMESLHFRCNLKIEVPLLQSSVKYLSDSSFGSHDRLGQAIDATTADSNMPRNFNLKSINYNHHGIFRHINWAQIIYSYPCLKKLVVWPYDYATYLNAIAQVKKEYPESLAQLETLHLFHNGFEPTEEHYRIARNLDFQGITTLHLGFHRGISYHSVFVLLTKWKTSLRNLTLQTYRLADQEEDPWVLIPQYSQVLTIGFVNLNYLKIPVQLVHRLAFDFLEYLPKLKVLDINDLYKVNFVNVLQNTSEDFCHESLIHIKSYGFPFEIPQEYQAKVKKLFPKFIFWKSL